MKFRFFCAIFCQSPISRLRILPTTTFDIRPPTFYNYKRGTQVSLHSDIIIQPRRTQTTERRAQQFAPVLTLLTVFDWDCGRIVLRLLCPPLFHLPIAETHAAQHHCLYACWSFCLPVALCMMRIIPPRLLRVRLVVFGMSSQFSSVAGDWLTGTDYSPGERPSACSSGSSGHDIVYTYVFLSACLSLYVCVGKHELRDSVRTWKKYFSIAPLLPRLWRLRRFAHYLPWLAFLTLTL